MDLKQGHKSNYGSKTVKKSSKIEANAEKEKQPRCQDNKIPPNVTLEEILERSGESDPEKVTILDLHACGITKIVHLDRLTSLKSLDLSCNTLKVIENLEYNKELKELKLYGNIITTVSGLSDLPNLESLTLQHNKLHSLANAFSGLRRLQYLRLDNNMISKIQPTDFNGCPSLETLDVSHNLLESLSPLKFASNLRVLCASFNLLKSVDCQTNINLTDLDLSGNKISNASGIAHLKNLQILRLNSNLISSLQTLHHCKDLQELHIANNQLKDLKYIRKQFPQLEVLNVANNKIVEWQHIEYLRFCKSLLDLRLEGNPCVTNFGCHGNDNHNEDGGKQISIADNNINVKPKKQLPHTRVDTTEQQLSEISKIPLSSLLGVEETEDIPPNQADLSDYQRAVLSFLPSLEVLDGVLMKKKDLNTASPLIRAMSPSTGMTIRHMENQLISLSGNLVENELSIQNTFSSIRNLMLSLPLHDETIGDTLEHRPTSKCSSKSRIADAILFASENFDS